MLYVTYVYPQQQYENEAYVHPPVMGCMRYPLYSWLDSGSKTPIDLGTKYIDDMQVVFDPTRHEPILDGCETMLTNSTITIIITSVLPFTCCLPLPYGVQWW